MAIKLTVSAKNGRDGDVEYALNNYFTDKLDGDHSYNITKGSDHKLTVEIRGLSHPLIADTYKQHIRGMSGVSKVYAETL